MKVCSQLFWIGAVLCSSANAAELLNFSFVARHYYPAGLADDSTALFGFGFGGLERTIYDDTEKIFYGASEQGFVTLSDFSSYPDNVTTPTILPLPDTATSIEICGSLLFVTTKDDPNPGLLSIFEAATLNADGTISPPTLIQTVMVGAGPDDILVSNDCQTVATANEGEGDYSDETGFVNPAGSVSILRGPFNDAANPPSVATVSLNEWSEADLMARNVHLPISLNSMIYWSEVLGDGFNADEAIANYQPEQVLEPEALAFSADESTIFVNLQENNALVTIDVATNTATNIFSYGVKRGFPVDIVDDGGCDNTPRVEGLSFIRSPDGIASFEVGGMQYIITANEGDDVEYGAFAEKVKARNIFAGDTLGFANMTADEAIFNASDITMGTSRFFNTACDPETNSEATPYCASSMSMSVGSYMVDYSDPTAPFIKDMVALGGRGITIFQVEADRLREVWDSGRGFETRGCREFPWAHNGIQDEEFAAVGGPLYNSLDEDDDLRTVIEEMNDPDVDGCADGGDGQPGACPLGQTIDERSQKDGYAAETVVVGPACGKLFAVTVSEKNSVGFLYDVSNPTQGQFTKAFHLSPASETLNPSIAYDRRLLGEIDAESIQFLTSDQSPTGNAAILFSGAFSGTTSLWEFECSTDAPTVTPVTTPPPENVTTAAPAPVDNVTTPVTGGTPVPATSAPTPLATNGTPAPAPATNATSAPTSAGTMPFASLASIAAVVIVLLSL